MICSTENRFLFPARLLALSGPIVPQTHPKFGLKNPEPLTLLWPCYADRVLSGYTGQCIGVASAFSLGLATAPLVILQDSAAVALRR